MPRNASNEEVKNESLFIEFQHSCSPNDLIQNIRRRVEQLPKDFSDPHLEPEFEQDGDERYFLGFRLDYARPLTDDEKKFELVLKKEQAERERQNKLKQYARLRQEFADVPEEEIAQLQEDEGPQPAVDGVPVRLRNPELRPVFNQWAVMPAVVNNAQPPAPQIPLRVNEELMWLEAAQRWVVVSTVHGGLIRHV